MGSPAPYFGRQALQPAPYPRAVAAIDVPELALEIGFLAGDHTVAMTSSKGTSVINSQRLLKAMAKPMSPSTMPR